MYVSKLVAIIACIISVQAGADRSKFDFYEPNSPKGIAIREARKAGIDPNLVLSILEHESRSCRLKTGPNTDLGCMQVSRATARALDLDIDRLVHDVSYNIHHGVAILAYFKARYEAKEPRTWFLRYNLGVGVIGPSRARLGRLYASKVGYQVPTSAKSHRAR